MRRFCNLWGLVVNWFCADTSLPWKQGLPMRYWGPKDVLHMPVCDRQPVTLTTTFVGEPMVEQHPANQHSTSICAHIDSGMQPALIKP